MPTLRENETEATCEACCGPIQAGDYMITEPDGVKSYFCLPCWDAGEVDDIDGESEEI